MSLRQSVLLMLVSGGWASSCADPTHKYPTYQLEGSLTAVMPLGYDEARVRVGLEDITLQFVRLHTIDASGDDAGSQMAGTTEDYPFQVTMALWGEAFPGNRRVDLTEEDMAMNQRGIYTRNVLNDPRKTFPQAATAKLYFKTTPQAGGKVSGDFNVTFADGVEAASGRTVFGTFEAKVAQ